MENSYLVEEYYKQNGKKLHGIVDRILRKFGGISEKDYDDFYSLANEVFVITLKTYDCKEGGFEGFLYSCLLKKIMSEITRLNRIKRTIDRDSVSIEALVEEGEGNAGDLLASDFCLERQFEEKADFFKNGKIQKYFSGISDMQRQILKLKMSDFSKAEILDRLKISEKTYNANFRQIKSFDKTRVLFENNDIKSVREEKLMEVQTSEVSKNTSYSINAYIKKLKNYSIRGDHPLQRNSNQWNSEQRYNLITTVLNRYPIPEVILAEQVKKNGTANWLIDGKQRLTNLLEYKENSFKIGKKAERPVIIYQTVIKDKKGNIMLDKSGAPKYDVKEYDVRGKYYSDLPEELQDRFNDYTIPAVQYLSCSDDDIEYHIRRYNAAKPMSVAQKGITHLGEQYAGEVKKIAEHPFFKDKGSFKISEFTNGTMDRVVTESIMAINFLGDWKKKQEDMCTYLKSNVRKSHFDSLGNILDRLSEAADPKTASMFNSKDAFLWFGLFNRFSELEFDDERFIDYMCEFRDRLHGKEVDGRTYDELCTKGTKDKLTVIEKLNIMEILMKEFLCQGERL